jgi:hypothetical protein
MVVWSLWPAKSNKYSRVTARIPLEREREGEPEREGLWRGILWPEREGLRLWWEQEHDVLSIERSRVR